MGTIYRVLCEACGESCDIATGMGKAHATLEKVAEYYPQILASEIKAYGMKNPQGVFWFQLQPAVCDTCKKIISVPVLKIKDTGAEYIGTCPDCHKEVLPVEKLQESLCPACKVTGLSVSRIGNWD